MAKAMLIMDMPSSCDKCPSFGSHYTDMTCRANGRSINYPYPKEKRQEWCPLREAPQKKEDNLSIHLPYNEGYLKGWNDCIDELLGGGE